MARNYAVNGQCSTWAAGITGASAIVNLLSTAATQPAIYEINSGSPATPANNALQFNIARISALGTQLGAITPAALDPGAGTAVASLTTASQGALALNTYTTAAVGVLQWAQNQNTAYRWVASSPSRMLVMPSTVSNGMGMLATVSTAVMNWSFGIHYEE